MAYYGLKMGTFHLFGHPKCSGIIFDQFLTHCFVPKQPIFQAFWEFWRAKMGHHRLKTCEKHLFWHPM